MPIYKYHSARQHIFQRYAQILSILLWVMCPLTVNAGMSAIYGKTGGTYFQDPATQVLTSVKISAGDQINSIQGISNSGDLGLPVHGVNGATSSTVTWSADEYLVRIYGTYGKSYVDQISFVTNKGRILGPYGSGISSTPKKSTKFDYTVPKGNAIAGFVGRSGDFINALGVMYITYQPASAGNLVVNGSFEEPVVAGGYGMYNDILGWAKLGDQIEIGRASNYGLSGATGTQIAELDSNVAGSGTGFFQNITTQAQQMYQVSVALAARAGTALTTNSVQIFWRNQYLGTIDPASTTFKTYTFMAKGSGGTDQLKFTEQDGDDESYGGMIDNVKLTKWSGSLTAYPDLSVTVEQPEPALTEKALSELPVKVTNIGSKIASSKITLTLPLPAGIEALPKFARNADAWVCLTQNSVVNCTYQKSIAPDTSTTLDLPIRALGGTVGSKIGPFIVSISSTGENNKANNSYTVVAGAVVKAMALQSVDDPYYSQPLLNSASIPKFAQPLPNAFGSFFRHTPDTTTYPGTNFYNLDIKQVKAQILPPGFPATDVFAYGDPARPDTYTYPAHTIVENSTLKGSKGKPVKIKFNDNRDPYQAHLLPIDHSIHGAMAQEPDIRSVAHVHGVKLVNENSDGYPESWFSPIGKTGGEFSVTTPTVGYTGNPFDQANQQESTLLWYHDHTLGMTRLNVYAGLAGLYLLRDANEQAMINNNSLPNGAYEIPLVLQDRMFHTDGSLAYPDRNPEVDTAPTVSMVPEFYGEVMVVNGAAWPFLEVEPRRYRFRMLNGSNSRFYNLTLSNGASFQVLGTEGGFLAAPVNVNTLTIGPGERYDLVVDFSGAAGQTIILTNSAASPFPFGAPVTAGLDDQIMQFRVNQPQSSTPNNEIPQTLLPNGLSRLMPTVLTPRQVLLAESTDNNGRILPILGSVQNGLLGWMDTVTETPQAGSIEMWEIYNDTVDAHPIHLHGGHFQLVNRQDYTAVEGLNHALTNITYSDALMPPAPQESTWKDTVITYPGQVTRILVKFANSGLFVWHCHILEHEDHDMMRPMLVVDKKVAKP